MKKLLYILLAICSVLVTGCLETKDDFTVNPDGSGKVVHELTVQPMNLGAMGGGGGLNMGGAEPPGGQTPDPQAELKKSAKGILDQSEGVDTWKDVSYSTTPDGRTYFKGTAYFSDINDLTLGTGQMSSDMGLHFSRDASGRIVIEIKGDTEAQDAGVAETNIPQMSEAELNEQLAEAKQQYNTMGKPMMQMMLSSFKSEVIFRLPGAIQEISNFQKVDASTVSLTIDGAKLFATMDRMMQDDAFLKEQIRTGNDPFSGGGGSDEANEMLFGEKGPIRVVVAPPTQPLFDYNAEMTAAKANYDQMIMDIGLEGVQSGTTGFSFPGEDEDLPKSEVKGRIIGTDVTLDKAKLDNRNLSIYAGDNWGSNPGLLVFMFLEEGTSLEGKSFSVDTAGGFQSQTPHVHYRWRDPGSQEIESEAVMKGYALELKFGRAVGGVLSGDIQFSVPGKDTAVAGYFKVNFEDPDAGGLTTVEVPADVVEDDITLITKSPFGGATPVRPKVAIPALPPEAAVPGRTIPLIAPEGTGDSNVRVAGARLVRYSNFELGVLPLGQRDGYTLSLIADLPVPAVKIAGGDVLRAVADNSVSLLPKREWDRKIRFARLSKDGKTAIFDIKLQLPDQSVLGLDELSGTLEYETASGVKNVDLGAIDFKSGAMGADLGAKISSIEVDPYGNNPTIVGLAVQTTPESVRSVEVYDGAVKLEVTRRGHLSVGGTTIIKFSVGSKLPSRGRIVLNILEQSEKNELSFRIMRISLAGQPMR